MYINSNTRLTILVDDLERKVFLPIVSTDHRNSGAPLSYHVSLNVFVCELATDQSPFQLLATHTKRDNEACSLDVVDGPTRV